MAANDEDASTYEQEHVHGVYEEIASHFSSTRYKPWPIVERFLLSRPKGSIGLDVGCGNGKYLTVNRDVFIVASDRSANLIAFAATHPPHSAVVADTLFLPHPPNTFDFAISIAVIHHLSTPARRIQAVGAILETLNAQACALIYVWALEQKNSRRGWEEGMAQDVMVPWVRKGKKEKATKAAATGTRQSEGTKEDGSRPSASDKEGEAPNAETVAQDAQQQLDQTFHRYYHLYRRGELEDDVRAARGVVIESGYEKDNWWAIIGRKRDVTAA